jgi:hypothetical protein
MKWKIEDANQKKEEISKKIFAQAFEFFPSPYKKDKGGKTTPFFNP